VEKNREAVAEVFLEVVITSMGKDEHLVMRLRGKLQRQQRTP
jgi:hypothetical protein